ncbi:MAG: hypothetical protein J6Q55_00770 [Clostridia bacterium]|nr:hypothetical protein [Clostridia bacterium]
MKKITKLLSLALVAMFACLALCGCNVPKSSLNQNANEFTKNWMSYIDNTTLVKEVAIPGSNDAGLSTCSRSAQTQHFTAGEQLDFGVRYLEINVRNKNDQLYAFYGSHTGEMVEDMLKDVVAFLKAHNTETVILDFTGFNNQPQTKLVNLIKKYLIPNGSYTYIVRNIYPNTSDGDFWNNTSLAQVAGRAIVFMDGDGNSYLDETFIFKRNDSNGNRLFTGLQSYCNTKLNKASSQKYIASLDTMLGRYATTNEGLCVLQGQLHDGTSLLGPAFYESKHASNMTAYINSLATSEHLSTVNVITRNFVDCNKACQIIALNSAKGNVKTALTEQFTQAIAEFN